MLYLDHWEQVKERMTAFWNREPMDRCCVAMQVPKPGYQPDGEGNLYYDAVKADRIHRHRFANHEYIGEAFPSLFPYFGAGVIAEYTGSKASNLPNTTWFEPWLDEPDADQIAYRYPEIFRKQKETIQQLLDLSKDDYLVSDIDSCGIIDTLALIRGSDNLLIDMLTEPDFVIQGMLKLMDIYKQTQNEMFDLIQKNNEGSTISWLDLWGPPRMAQIQCDLSVMISSEMFNRFVMPELEELSMFLDYMVYHLDGAEQIRHLDALLSLKNLSVIQWNTVPSQPKTSEFIPELQRIQKAGVNLLLSPQVAEIPKLLNSLSSRGLMLNIKGIRSREEAEDVMKLIYKHSEDRG